MKSKTGCVMNLTIKNKRLESQISILKRKLNQISVRGYMGQSVLSQLFGLHAMKKAIEMRSGFNDNASLLPEKAGIERMLTQLERQFYAAQSTPALAVA
jgi:hypothetical protein